MSRKEKLIQRFKLEPKDFSFEELITLLGYCGYILESSGKTSGSVVTFTKRIVEKSNYTNHIEASIYWNIKLKLLKIFWKKEGCYEK